MSFNIYSSYYLKTPKSYGPLQSICVCIFQSLGICSLIEVIGQTLASLHHADNIRDYTNDPDEIEQD